MKKVLLPILLLAGVGAGFAGLSNLQVGSTQLFAETETNHYMPFETSFTSGDQQGQYSRLGVLKNADATTWSGRYNALDRFFTGEGSGIGEDVTGYIDSVSWQQKKANPYVYFTWAGNTNNAVEIRKVSDPNAETPVARINNDQFNGNTMVVNYIQIDTSSLTENEELFLRLVDNSVSDYGFNSFGYLHVNASATDVSDAIWQHINSLSMDYNPENLREANFRIRETMNIYLNGKANNDGILPLSSNKNVSVNDDFENNAAFMQKWYRDTEYDLSRWWVDGNENNSSNIYDGHTVSLGTIISFAEHHHNNNNLPFNKTGDGFFKGFYEDSTGFIDTDNARYRFVTKPFVLSGTGLISVKMAGRSASLHVLKGNAELAFIDVKTFAVDGKDAANIASGFNSCTMVRHVINLEAFLGQTIQLAIADVDVDGNWGAANYDELITKYDTYPSFQVDEAVQNSIHNYYLDKYVSSSNADIIYTQEGVRNAHSEDTSAMKEAHDFLDYYYTNFRNSASSFSFCEVSDEVKNTLMSKYNALSASAKNIVEDSEDLDFAYGENEDRSKVNWYDKTLNQEHTVGEILRYIAARYDLDISVNSARTQFGLDLAKSPVLWVAVVLIAGVLLPLALLALRKRKKKSTI